jgi:hypothetical protein
MMASVGRAAERRMRRFTTTEATATTATAAMEAMTTVELVAVDEVTVGIMLLFDPFFGCPFAGDSFFDDPLVADLPDLPACSCAVVGAAVGGWHSQGPSQRLGGLHNTVLVKTVANPAPVGRVRPFARASSMKTHANPVQPLNAEL